MYESWSVTISSKFRTFFRQELIVLVTLSGICMCFKVSFLIFVCVKLSHIFTLWVLQKVSFYALVGSVVVQVMQWKDRNLWRARVDKRSREKLSSEVNTGTRVEQHGPCWNVAGKASLNLKQRIHTGTRVHRHGPCEKVPRNVLFLPEQKINTGTRVQQHGPCWWARAEYLFPGFLTQRESLRVFLA